MLVGVVADELPGAGDVAAGALDDEAVGGAHDVDAADAPAVAGEVDEDRAAVDEGRLHRLAADLYHPAVAGDEPVAGEPRPAELDAPGDAFLLDDGPVVGGRGQLGDADVVAVLEVR